MAIPKYDEMYPAILSLLSDGAPHSMKELYAFVANELGVTKEECRELLPSGKQTVLVNRVAWARTYLAKAGLLTNTARGVWALSETGKRVLQERPAVIDNMYLRRFESFRDFKGELLSDNTRSTAADDGQTPQDVLDSAYRQINAALADELLAEIMKKSPAFFESLVVKLLQKMGYGGSLTDAGRVVGKSGDEGIDGIIREDKLGFDLIYIQAKRWDRDTAVGRPEIQKFVGALAGQGATKGLFITTAQFSKEAYAYAKRQHTTKVVLVDGIQLAQLMIDYDVGVSTEIVYTIKHLDTDFFGEELD